MGREFSARGAVGGGSSVDYVGTMLLLLVACLFDSATYEARRRELTEDADGDGVVLAFDCDDGDASVFPGAGEFCDGKDQNCNGAVDDGLDTQAERCDGLDNDCDGVIDDAPVDGSTWYGDADQDGYGLATVVLVACSQPPDYAAVGTDCDDGNAARHPDAAEVPYDGIDQDCSGADLVDVDGDGEASDRSGGRDCDDDDAARYPAADETWADGFVDNDCDGELEAITLEYATEAWVGRAAGGHAGGELAALGDVDGDGSAELAIAAYYDGSLATAGGAVFLVSASEPGALAAATTLESSASGAYLGTAMNASDLDDDGALELLLSATGMNDGRGSVYWIQPREVAWGSPTDVSEASSTEIRGEQAQAYFGAEVAAVPDIDGDGLDDVAISAPLASVGGLVANGAVYLFSAAEITAGGSVASDVASVVWYGNVDDDNACNGVLSGSDQNGDGLTDVVIYDGANEVWLVTGHPPSGALAGLAAAHMAVPEGDSRLIGDVDDDGVDDLVVLGNSPLIATDLLGNPDWVATDAYASIDTDGDRLTDAVDLHDRDGDGRAETLFFVPQDSSSGTGLGGIVLGADVRHGATVQPSESALIVRSTRPGSWFGWHAVAVGSLHGADDEWLAVGGPLDDEGGVDAGAVAVLPIPE